MICTFIGNREYYENINEQLRLLLINLISFQNAHTFYVGNHGAFDRCVVSDLKQLKQQFPHIHYYVVLAYFPTDKYLIKEHPTLMADGVEEILPRFRILYRNKWMISQADTVICYVRDITGKARDFAKYAERCGKNVIHL